mgnify:CR=1 FL=1
MNSNQRNEMESRASKKSDSMWDGNDVPDAELLEAILKKPSSVL